MKPKILLATLVMLILTLACGLPTPQPAQPPDAPLREITDTPFVTLAVAPIIPTFTPTPTTTPLPPQPDLDDVLSFGAGATNLPDNPTSSCPGAPPQQMTVNQRGYVCTRSDPVRLRTSPARSASALFQLEPGTQFTIIGGPSCSDNWSWWNIRLDDGTTGWVSEGGDEIDPYFICPSP
jgi:hypothetical protein